MRPSERRRGAALLLFTVVTTLALATFASAGPVNALLTAHTPLPPSKSADPSGRLPAFTAGERSEAHRDIGRQRLVIPSVGVGARWVNERLNDEQLGVPANVHLTGLWAGGGLISGGRGTVLIDGHVNYVGQGEGALYPLSRVKPGALIGTSMRSGKTVWWRTVHVVQTLKQTLPQSIFTDTGTRQLVIVTCGGVLEADGHYDDNVVLYARPVLHGRATANTKLTGHVKGMV